MEAVAAACQSQDWSLSQQNQFGSVNGGRDALIAFICAQFFGFFFVSFRLILFLSDLQAIRLIMHWGI